MQTKLVSYVIAIAVTATSLVGFSVAKAATAPASLIISAVQITGGVGKTSEDFIELFNPTSEPINLNGYRLVKRTATATTDSSIKSWTSDAFVPAYSFYLWANSTFTTIPVVPDLTTSSTLSDNNGIALRLGAADTGQIIDSLSWGTTTNGFSSSGLTNPIAGESIMRNSLYDVSSYVIALSNPRNSTIQQLPEPVPVVEPPVVEPPVVEPPVVEPPIVEPPVVEPPVVELPVIEPPIVEPPIEQPPVTEPPIVEPPVVEPPLVEPPVTEPPVTEPPVVVPPIAITYSVKISEVLPNPIGKDSGKETVELYNYGSEIINLDGWFIDAVSSTQDQTTKAFELTNLQILPDQYLAVVIPQGKFSMNNKAGSVTLFDSEGQSVSSVAYNSKAPNGKSYSLINDSWQWTNSTFGLENILPIVQTSDDDAQDEPVNSTPKTVKTDLVPSLKTKTTSAIKKATSKVKTKATELKKSVQKAVSKTTKTSAKKTKSTKSTSTTKNSTTKSVNSKDKSKTDQKTPQDDAGSKPNNPAGILALAIASLSAGGLAVYRYGVGGLF